MLNLIFYSIRLNTYLLIHILKYITKEDSNIDLEKIYNKGVDLAFNNERKEI